MNMHAQLPALFAYGFALAGHAALLEHPPNASASIRAKAGPSEIVITTTARLAGAIHSLTWNGKEFIDSADHGRQLQSAANFDAGQPFVSETFNPTEAGSRRDSAGPTSSSKLRSLTAAGAEPAHGHANGILACSWREIRGPAAQRPRLVRPFSHQARPDRSWQSGSSH